MKTNLLAAAGVFLLAALTPFRVLADTDLKITLVGDMYPAGRKAQHPTPANPAYYYAMVEGYREMGPGVQGMVPPPTPDVIHHFALALASQGYLVTHEIQVPGKAGSGDAGEKAFSPPPSLLLFFDWGYLNPNTMSNQVQGSDVTDVTTPSVLNRDQMIGLTAGKNYDSVAAMGMQETRQQEIEQGITDQRYFVMVSAYDFNDYFQRHKKTLLWVAKISTPSIGATMTEVTAEMIDHGAVIFGRETVGPNVMAVPEGHVEVGTPTVKDVLPTPAPGAAQPAP